MPGPPEPQRHGVVLLCAGGSRRLGFAKQLVRLEGETLVRRAARLALATGPADAVAVLGAGHDAVSAELAGLPLRPVVNAAWTTGLAGSLRMGLRALDARCAGALVLLADQPGLGAEHLAALLAAWRGAPLGAAASGYSGVAGVPAVLPRGWFAALDGVEGDRGARDLLRARREEVRVVPDEALARDVDLPGDLPQAGER